MRFLSRARIHLAVVAILAFSAITPSWAAPGPQVDREEFAARRNRLYDKMGDGIAVIFSAKEQIHAVKFRQAPSFYYLTGVEEADSILVLVGGKRHAFLFAPERSAGQVRVEGPGIWQVENREEAYGLTKVFPLKDFLTILGFLAQGSKTLYMQVTAEDSLQQAREEAEIKNLEYLSHPGYQTIPENKQAVARIHSLLPDLTVKDINPFIDELRWVKTPYEIERARRSGKIGSDGVTEAIRVTKPGMFEYELEASARYVQTKAGARGDAFTPIVASGPNATTLHYNLNNRRMEAGELVYMDYGADYDYYTSDITRTWPVSGKFTPEQEKMYRCVLEARDAVIAAMKPGMTIPKLKDIAEEVYKKHGYLKEFIASGRYLGHYVGMSVHDVTPDDPNVALVPGVIFNVEPILEFPDRKIHIRLEDTILITQTGAENLTASVPAGVAEVQALMNQR